MWPKFQKYQINYFRYTDYTFCVFGSSIKFSNKKSPVFWSLAAAFFYIFFPVILLCLFVKKQTEQ